MQFQNFFESVNSYSWGKKNEREETSQVKGKYFHSNFFQSHGFVLKSGYKSPL